LLKLREERGPQRRAHVLKNAPHPTGLPKGKALATYSSVKGGIIQRERGISLKGGFPCQSQPREKGANSEHPGFNDFSQVQEEQGSTRESAGHPVNEGLHRDWSRVKKGEGQFSGKGGEFTAVCRRLHVTKSGRVRRAQKSLERHVARGRHEKEPTHGGYD